MRNKILVALTAFTLFMFLALPAMAQTGEEVGSFDWAWLNAILAFFLPLAISFLKKASWSPQVKRVFAFVISAALGVVTVGFNQEWAFASTSDFFKLTLASITQIWIIAQVAYMSFWQDTKTEVALATSGVK